MKQGYIVRTRSDADTKEGRTGDTTTRDKALKSGAQMISTDYPWYEPVALDRLHRRPARQGVGPLQPGRRRRLQGRRAQGHAGREVTLPPPRIGGRGPPAERSEEPVVEGASPMRRLSAAASSSAPGPDPIAIMGGPDKPGHDGQEGMEAGIHLDAG